MAQGRPKKRSFRPRHIVVLWKTKRQLVEKEIERMRDEDDKTGSDFQLRTAASKNVLANMSEHDLKLLNDAVKDMAESGYPEIEKRR